MTARTAVGISSVRRDGPEKVTGRAQYADDLKRPGMLHGAIVGSPWPHARILSIDTAEAEATKGVVAVLTASDLPDKRVGSFVKDETTLARGVARFVGEPVAAIAADTPEIARAAALAIDVEYDPLDAATDLDEALAPDGPLVHPDAASYAVNGAASPDRNVFWSASIHEGEDIEVALAACDVVVEGIYETPAQYHAYMEPCSALADIDLSGRLTVTSSAQSIFYLQGRIAEELDIPMTDVRCIAPKIGGGFGGKNGVNVQIIAAALAQKTGRPVKITLSRAEDMEMLRSRHPARIRMRTGAMADGTLIARDVEAWFDAGAYADESPAVMSFGILMARGPYRIANVRSVGRTVYTNKLKAGSFRGFGNPQATFASESQLDEVAGRLGIDPVDLRRRNAMVAGDRWLGGQPVEACAALACLEAANARVEADAGDLPPPVPGVKRGIGLASFSHISGLMGTSANVNLRGDGTVVLSTGVVDIGQGSDIALSQICAETLQLPVDAVAYAGQDTDLSPYNWKTAASRITYMAGRAVTAATEQMRERMIEHAADMLECAASDLTVTPGGKITVIGTDRAVTFREIATRAFNRIGGPLVGQAAFAYDGARFDPKRALLEGFAFDNLGIYVFGTVAVAVDVDTLTGKVEVLKVWSAHDVGRAINPGSVEGQIQGAVAQGLGYALSEELVWDEGRLANPSLVDYKVPSVLDLPDEIVPILIEEAPEATGPFGAKGIGEAGIVGVAPAVANAVANATGVRLRKIPLTGERVLDALEAAEAETDPQP